MTKALEKLSDQEFYEKCVPEILDRCVLVCANCHAVVHAVREIEWDKVFYDKIERIKNATLCNKQE